MTTKRTDTDRIEYLWKYGEAQVVAETLTWQDFTLKQYKEAIDKLMEEYPDGDDTR